MEKSMNRISALGSTLMTEHNAPESTSTLDSSRERFLSPIEAANYLNGLNPRTVTRWAREGYLPAYPIGEGKRRLWRFRRGDLEGWLLSRSSKSILAEV
jgi:excisionase family DNA binding protein